LKWARERDCLLTEMCCSLAADKGYLGVLKWLRANGCPWSSTTCNRAAEKDHLHILKWARENGCPWKKYVCRIAARNGDIDMLNWAKENGCPWDPPSFSCRSRVGTGLIPVSGVLFFLVCKELISGQILFLFLFSAP